MSLPQRRNVKKSRRQSHHAPHSHTQHRLLGEDSPLRTGGVGISDNLRRSGISERAGRLDDYPTSLDERLAGMSYPGSWLEGECLEESLEAHLLAIEETRLLRDYEEATDGDDGEEYLEPGDYEPAEDY